MGTILLVIIIARCKSTYTALISMATTKKKRSFDAVFKLRGVEYAKIRIEVLSKNCSRSRIVDTLHLVASLYFEMKILVAAASDRANMVFVRQMSSHNSVG